MQELIEKLKSEAGLTEEQAKKAIETVKNFVVDKFPMLEGAVGGLFGGEVWLTDRTTFPTPGAVCSFVGCKTARTALKENDED